MSLWELLFRGKCQLEDWTPDEMHAYNSTHGFTVIDNNGTPAHWCTHCNIVLPMEWFLGNLAKQHVSDPQNTSDLEDPSVYLYHVTARARV